MREIPTTNCEKKFLIKCLAEFTRLDGRAFDECRELQIQFGKDWGCCHVSLGDTRVLAQTSCEIQQPKTSRPSEGILILNVELNPLAAPNFEPGRPSELSVLLNRQLEKSIKDSKAIDLESLCIKTNEKVWALRVDINILNHAGNILDCASVAALAALAHFKRPDATCDGEEFIIHTYAQRDPIPIVIHHYPVCSTYAIFSTDKDVIVSDPTLLEEAVADAIVTIGLNGFKELCGLHLGGKALMAPDTILNIVQKATNRSLIVIENIKSAIKMDAEEREKNPKDFNTSIVFGKSPTVLDLQMQLDEFQLKSKRKNRHSKSQNAPQNEEVHHRVDVIEPGSAEFVSDIWKTNNDDDVIVIDTSEIKKDPDSPIAIGDSDSEEIMMK